VPFDMVQTQSERGASVSSDGARIVFELTPAAGITPATIMIDDQRTGREASVPSLSQPASDPFDPSISPDGQTILTGGPFQPLSPPLYVLGGHAYKRCDVPDGTVHAGYVRPAVHVLGAGRGGSGSSRKRLSDRAYGVRRDRQR
jgi:WD40-like Beta Propeller Repeat